MLISTVLNPQTQSHICFTHLAHPFAAHGSNLYQWGTKGKGKVPLEEAMKAQRAYEGNKFHGKLVK
jgi:hypothetical protein